MAYCLLPLTKLSLTARLHEVLMDLQHKQLQQLTDWLDVTEARIKRMGAQPLGPDLEDVKHQVEEHKVGTSWAQACSRACYKLNFVLSFNQFENLRLSSRLIIGN